MSGSDLAFPLAPYIDNSGDMHVYRSAEPGLTKRELFAALAMQGFCMNAVMPKGELGERTSALANLAVLQADALLEALRHSGRD